MFRTRGLELTLWSSAIKVNTQYMHCIYFTLKLKRAASRDEILARLRADERISLTKKQAAGEVFSFGRDHGYFGRILNQTVIVEPALEVRKGHEVIGFLLHAAGRQFAAQLVQRGTVVPGSRRIRSTHAMLKTLLFLGSIAFPSDAALHGAE